MHVAIANPQFKERLVKFKEMFGTKMQISFYKAKFKLTFLKIAERFCD